MAYTALEHFILDDLFGYATLNALIDNDEYNRFPVGTALVFYQAAAPTGWTKQTVQNDKYLRVVSGTGGGSGGTVAASAGITVAVPGHGHKWNNATTGLNTGQFDMSTASAGSFGTGSGSSLARLGNYSSSGGVNGDASFNAPTINPAYIDCIVCTRD
jgi:hypothetical protein